MKLALRMRRPDVDAMLNEISTRQYNEWRAYDHLWPIGDERIEVVLARGFLAICNCLGWKYKVEYFLPFSREPEVEQSEDDYEKQAAVEIAKMRQFAQAKAAGIERRA